MSLAILNSATAVVRSAALVATTCSLPAWAAKWSRASRRCSPVISERLAITFWANSGWVLMPVPTAVPPRGSSPRPSRERASSPPARVHLAEVAAENLAEADRRGVLQMGAADGDDVVEGQRLLAERLLHAGQGRDQALADLDGGGQVHGRGDHVVARLAEVDVVVGMDRMAAGRFAEQLGGAVGQHLVGIHVGAGSRAGLEDVEGEVRVQVAAHHLRRGRGDRLGAPFVEQAKFEVDLGGLLLDQAQGAQERAREGQPGDREILDGAGGLRSVEGVGGNRHRAERIVFGAGGRHEPPRVDEMA